MDTNSASAVPDESTVAKSEEWQRNVRVAITDTTTSARRDLTLPFSSLLTTIAELGATERLGPAYTDDPACDDAGGILILEAIAQPKRAETFEDLYEWAKWSLLSLDQAAVIGVPFSDADGRFKGARFVVALDDNDPAETEAIGRVLTEHSGLAGMCIELDASGKPRIGGRVRVVEDVSVGHAASCSDGSEFLTYGNGLLPLSDEQRWMLDYARAALWPKVATDFERAASLLGSADPVFFAATRDLEGQAVWDMMEKLQAAAAHPDPLADFVRTKVVPLARQHRDAATDRARFDVLMDGQLQRFNEYADLSASDVRLIKLAAWLFAAPPSLFVGKGASNLGTLIRPGHGGPSKHEWLVDGWLPRIGVGAIVGGAGEGKSQIAADFAARIATVPLDGKARRFAGRAVSGAPSVLYFGSEGVEGWTARAERQIAHVSGRPATEAHGLYVANGVPLLSSPIVALTAVREAVAQILKNSGEMPAAIIIDHLRGAMTGNEDNSGDMDLACSTAWMIARMCGCCVVLIHHARKNTDGGTIVARGSSALRANLDFEATVKKDDAGYHLTVSKNRNGAEGDRFTWHVPAIDAPVREGEALRAPDQRKLSEQAAEVAGRVIREIATKVRGVTTRELNDALIGAQPALFLKPDEKRDGSRLLRARTDAIAAGYIAEGKSGKWIVGERDPQPEPSPFDLSGPPAPLDDLLSANATGVEVHI